MNRVLQALQRGFDALLFPDAFVCPVCGSEAILGEAGVCDTCRGQLRHCGPLPATTPLDGLYANYSYDPILRPAMHRFKYKRQTWLARFFLQDMEFPTDEEFDAIVPVPMHPLKEYLRTYNPPEALALVLQQLLLETPIRTDLLKKTKLTPSQTTLHAADRSRNVADVFRASAEVQGMSLLLVDDVTTTGSTLIACAKALKAQGARRVIAVCACKAQIGEDDPNEEIETED